MGSTYANCEQLIKLGEMLDLSGKVAVVTGGAQGIGKGVARKLMEAGARVILADISFGNLDNEKDASLFESACRVNMDVTDEESVATAAREIERKVGTVDILINNAGTIYKDYLEDVDFGKWKTVLEVNTTGPAICMKWFVPGMKSKRWGRVVNISSVQAYLATPRYSAYGASKAALSQLTRIWAAEVAPFNITVNAICPGYADTAMANAALANLCATKGVSRDEALQELLAPVPMRRLIRPEEIGWWVVVLCSDWASGLTGANIAVSAGWVMH